MKKVVFSMLVLLGIPMVLALQGCRPDHDSDHVDYDSGSESNSAATVSASDESTRLVLERVRSTSLRDEAVGKIYSEFPSETAPHAAKGVEIADKLFKNFANTELQQASKRIDVATLLKKVRSVYTIGKEQCSSNDAITDEQKMACLDGLDKYCGILSNEFIEALDEKNKELLVKVGSSEWEQHIGSGMQYDNGGNAYYVEHNNYYVHQDPYTVYDHGLSDVLWFYVIYDRFHSPYRYPGFQRNQYFIVNHTTNVIVNEPRGNTVVVRTRPKPSFNSNRLPRIQRDWTPRTEWKLHTPKRARQTDVAPRSNTIPSPHPDAGSRDEYKPMNPPTRDRNAFPSRGGNTTGSPSPRSETPRYDVKPAPKAEPKASVAPSPSRNPVYVVPSNSSNGGSSGGVWNSGNTNNSSRRSETPRYEIKPAPKAEPKPKASAAPSPSRRSVYTVSPSSGSSSGSSGGSSYRSGSSSGSSGGSSYRSGSSSGSSGGSSYRSGSGSGSSGRRR